MRILKILLAPLLVPVSALYAGIMTVRNFLYDKNILKSSHFPVPVISVGNLSAGGTGKTPFIEYLIRNTRGRYRTATLSRGYKRQSKGFILADSDTTAASLGDEPFGFYRKFPDIRVAVCEDRETGIRRLLETPLAPEVVLLDDAFQHRKVARSLDIMLMDYARPFYRDYVLPYGFLREPRCGYRRADIIIVTKCPADLSPADRAAVLKKIHPGRRQSVFFTSVVYGQPYNMATGKEQLLAPVTDILLVTGIAHPEPLVQYLKDHHKKVHLIRFPDHHTFAAEDLQRIARKWQALGGGHKMLLTTEKDASRLGTFADQMKALSLSFSVMPITIHFPEGEQLLLQQLSGVVPQ